MINMITVIIRIYKKRNN